MKSIITILVIFSCLPIFSQKHELGLNLRAGFPTQNMGIFIPDAFKRYEYLDMRSASDIGIIAKYKYLIWKKKDVYISEGIELSRSTHYQPIFALGHAKMHLDNIVIKKNRLGLSLFGLHKQFNFYNNNLIIDLGCDLVYKFYFSKSDNYNSDFIKNDTPTDQWIEYKYNLTTYYNEYYKNTDNIKKYRFLFCDWNLQLKFSVQKHLYFDLGFNYMRDNFFFSDYNYTVRYYINGNQNPSGYHSYLGTAPPYKEGVLNHNFYLTFGLSYKFGKAKIE